MASPTRPPRRSPRRSPEELLRDLSDEGQLVHLHRLPARAAHTGSLAAPLPPALEDALLTRAGVTGFWSHQAEAIDHLRAGRSVAVATGTASGKSLGYQVPIAEAVLDDPAGTALLVFPTKALAQDQLRALTNLAIPGLVAATYDGDTPTDVRTWVRRHANVILTNPEMLHGALLPNHARWAGFLRRLRYVVVDELHTLRGIFGTHTAHVLRRLRRVAALHGSRPTFAFSSATIGDPAGLAAELCGTGVVAVLDDGSPRSERLLALWNPPLVDDELGLRASSNAEVARLVAALVGADRRTVAFCRSRRGTEVVAADVRRRLDDPRLSASVRSYRAGYLAAERREIEQDLFEGRVRAVVATSALELGVDIGGLDACVLNGFPGTIASMWQQIGRAGRTAARDGAPSVAVLVAGNDQLDQWLMTHPTEVVTRPPEPAVVNPSNPMVLDPHLACAAYESPLVPEDDRWWGDDLADGVRRLVLDDRLRVREGRAYWAARGTPATGIGLRSGSAGEVRIIEEDGRLVGTVDTGRAPEQVHPGAIYLHLGQQYRVLSLDLEGGRGGGEAVVAPVEVDEHTQVRSELHVALLGEDRHHAVGRSRLAVGPVEVTSRVIGYERRESRSGRVFAREQLDLPPSTLVTRGFWYTIDDEVLAAARLAPSQVLGALHAAEHAGIGILPLFTICDRWDVGGLSTRLLPDTGRATIVIHEGYPGGVGIAELGFSAGRRHLEATRAVIERCPCRRGCPSCVQSPKCGNGNEPLDKAGALALLRAILGGP